MKLIDRHVLRHFLVPFVYILVSLLGLFLVYDVSSKTGRFLKQQVPLLTILRFYSLYVPQLITFGLPMVVLLAIVLGVGRMSKNNEITAMRACGVSILRIARPLFAAGLLLAATSFVLFEKVVSRTYGETERFEQALKGKENNTDVISEGHFLTDDSGSLLHFHTYRRKEKTFETLSWEKEANNPEGKIIVTAGKAMWKANSWWAFDVKVIDSHGTVSPLYKKMKMYEWDFRPEEVVGQRWPEEMDLGELLKNIRRYRTAPQKVSALEIQFHRRLAFPMLNLLVVAVALPFGLKGGKGGGSMAIGVGVCMLLCVAYYGLSVLLLLFRGLPPWVAVWLPNVLFGAGGAIGTLRMR